MTFDKYRQSLRPCRGQTGLRNVDKLEVWAVGMGFTNFSLKSVPDKLMVHFLQLFYFFNLLLNVPMFKRKEYSDYFYIGLAVFFVSGRLFFLGNCEIENF